VSCLSSCYAICFQILSVQVPSSLRSIVISFSCDSVFSTGLILYIYIIAIRARDRPLDREKLLLGDHLHDFAVLERDSVAAHVASHTMTLVHTPRLRAHTDGSGFAVEVGAVRSGASGKVMSLDDALETLALGNAGQRNSLHVLEQGEVEGLAFLEGLGAFDAEFLQRFELHVLGRFFVRVESQDYRRISVFHLGFHLHNRVRFALDEGDWDHLAIVLEDVCHPQFFAYNAWHSLSG